LPDCGDAQLWLCSDTRQRGVLRERRAEWQRMGLSTSPDTAMPVTQQVFAADFDEQDTALSRVDAAQEDEYWRRAFWCERYYSEGLDY
jgi:hypothetical protein